MTLSRGGADGLPHMGLTPHLPITGRLPCLAQSAHHLGDAFEDTFAGPALLDHALPPALGVGIACRFRQPADRVAEEAVASGRGDRIVRALAFLRGWWLFVLLAETHRDRQVDET